MKKTIATFCLIGSTIALSACTSSQTYSESEYPTPYSMERTATHAHTATEQSVVEIPKKAHKMEKKTYKQKPAEKVFQRAQQK